MTRAQAILAELVAAAERDGFVAHGIHVGLGDDTAAHLWGADEPRDVQSVAKGVCVLAAGIAADEGLFDLDVPLPHYLPDYAYGAGSERVTVRHLLAMTSGIDLPWTPTIMTDWPDLSREFLSRPSAGRVFDYSTASAYTAMRALAAVVGDVAEWLEPRLFAQLGIADPQWDRCPNGAIAAAGGLHLRLDELARIGRLISDGGVWLGKRLVGEQWVLAMHSDWSEHDAPPSYRRYALAGWGGPGDAWRLHGAGGQLLVFLDGAVVTVLADDHPGADRMTECIVDALAAEAA